MDAPNDRITGMVSVIIPVFNRTDLLQHAVASVLSQDHRPIEILVVDDGSTDRGTTEALAALASEHAPYLRVLRRDNGGPGLARETGRKAARGEFVQYLDSDDVLLPGKFSAQIAALRRDPVAGVAYGITWYRDADGRCTETPHKETGLRRDAMFPAFLVSRWWETATPVYRASVCDAAGPWTDLRLEEDWEYDCRIAALGTRLAYCARPVSEHRDHAGPRLSRGKALDPVRLRARARSHALVWQHAMRAGMPKIAPVECSHFGRSVFLIARQCLCAGLPDEARSLLRIAAGALAGDAVQRRQLRWFESLAAVVGPTVAARLYDMLARTRRGWSGMRRAPERRASIVDA
jgi:hypothetical protein